ncbi:MAG TPA: lipid IV(A) 3-deoxy-D-manno-octulosonic acid transferase [Woeseiaceae bacterium]|nr:lipid IV(A) 3-deoxy-D-manno-octulosonic acid transferase [Woeseiaceae bacterium]
MKLLYHLLTYVLFVPFALYWLVRALVNREYRPQLAQRFGFGYPRLDECLWVHAVSVGEVVAAAPLIRSLQRQWPDHPLLVTTVTPTGAARVHKLFGNSVAHAYIPFETPDAVGRFFDAVQPAIALVMETEIWPNLYRECGERKIPLVLVSARISPRSVNSYRKLLPLFRETLSHGIVIAAQSEADADRFMSLGASRERTRVIGNIKFDPEMPPDLIERGARFRHDVLKADRPVWIAASTHEGEEERVLDAHARLRMEWPDLLLVLVPRHPQRFAAVRDVLERRSIPFVTRSSGAACAPDTSVYLGDTMGDVPLFYAASDIAFVGGSLVPVGGHNLLEPAAFGIPILTGPHVFNAQEIAESFIEHDACRLVEDTDGLVTMVHEFLSKPDTRRQVGAAARNLLDANRGALSRLMSVITPLVVAR